MSLCLHKTRSIFSLKSAMLGFFATQVDVVYYFMLLTAAAVLKKSENVVFRKIEGEYILVPIVSSAADVESIFNLNETGAAIWDKLDGKKSLKNIIAEIQEEYEVEGHQLEKDVISFVDEMVAAKLVEA